jgi:hypothetical protein
MMDSAHCIPLLKLMFRFASFTQQIKILLLYQIQFSEWIDIQQVGTYLTIFASECMQYYFSFPFFSLNKDT